MLVKINATQQENVMNVKKVRIKDGAHKESTSTGGTNNYQIQKEGNDKNYVRTRICDNRRKKDLVYINLERVRESIHIYI